MNDKKNIQKIGVFGGTFDPFHNGHLIMAKEAVRLLQLDRLLVIPAGNPYLKGKITPYPERFEMVREALRDLDPEIYEVSRLEEDDTKPTYTYLTLQRLHEEYPESELFFICGRDVYEGIKNWRCPEEILKEAALAVFDRPDEEKTESQSGEKEAEDTLKEIYPGARCVFLKAEIPSVSSTGIRERVKCGKEFKESVPEGVAEYISEHGLYR